MLNKQTADVQGWLAFNGMYTKYIYCHYCT